MKSVNPMMVVAVLLWVVCGAAWAGGSIEFSGGFSGGTVPNAVVLTGDNASGTGTLQIRPSDEDTQLVLCDQSNNSSPEVCAAFSFANFSTNEPYLLMGNNTYYNTSTSKTRYNTSRTAPYVVFRGGNSDIASGVYMGAINVAGTDVGLWQCALNSGGTTATCTASSGNTTDLRGPILNGGSATCGGLAAGSVCVQDTAGITVESSGSSTLNLGFGTTASAGQVVVYNASDVAMGGFGCVGSAADADIADTCYIGGVTKLLVYGRTDDVAAGTMHSKWIDNYSASGVELMTLDGAGNLFLNASATRTKGTITLAAGTGTATVASGSICVCTDTTANASVRCAVATTTLTATGTGTDVIAYHCL
jgi:hypothetical protein